MSLCEACRKALPSIPVSGSNEGSIATTSKTLSEHGDWRRSQLPEDCWYLGEPFLHTSWESLLISLSHNCPVCWTLWRNIRSSPIASSTNERITEFKAKITKIDHDPNRHQYYVELKLTGHGLKTKYLLFYVSKTTEKCYLEAEREFPLAGQHTPKSAADAANRWIKACEAGHQDCLKQGAPPKDEKMPTRLLYLGDVNSKVWRIYQDPGHVPYAALSHRWSSDTPELHTSNCENYCHPQPDSALPQNYQDIISICRAMSIRYLWVDSLCIIQDDNGYEFQKEAPLMMNIYQFAVVTLSICWDFPGLSIFRRCSPRSIPRPRPPACYGKHNCGLVSDEWVFVQERETEDNELRLHVSQAPINQRAWVLQERCLSRRLLYLGNDQLYWECDGCTGSEASPESIYAYGGRQSIRALTWRNKDTAWGHMLTQYTGSDLTFENDRLVAMAGLARLIASKTGGTYFAGIWLDSWMGDLLWEPVEERARSSKLKAQEIAMVSPSWSWLIFSGTVRPCLTDLHNGPKISIANPNSFDSGDYQLLALLSQAVVIPPTSDPFAFFERAILKIRCLLLPVTFAGILPSDKQSCFFRHDYDVELSSVGLDCFRLQVCEPYGNIYFTFRFVFSKPLDMSLQYFLLPLYFRQLPPRIYGLVLQKGLRNGSEEYTRAGMWCEDLPVPSQLSPMISNTIIRLGVGKNSTLSYGRLTENEHVFDSKLRKYAAGHVASKVRFPMTVVKKVREHQSDSGELDEKASVSGSEAAGRGLKEADEEEGPFIRIKEVECSLLPHFTTAKWGTVSLV